MRSVLLAAALALVASTAEARPAHPAAVGAVHAYLQGLLDGDVNRMRGKMKPHKDTKEARKLLRRSGYGAKLRQEYANSSYKILASEQLRGGRATVDVRIMMDETHPLTVRFVLEAENRNNYVIVDEI